MKLKTITLESNTNQLMEAYEYNSKLIGVIRCDKKMYQNFIKILTIYPLTDKKLKYFLKLDPNARTGFLSRYIIKIGKQIGVPKAYIKGYLLAKEDYWVFKRDIANTKRLKMGFAQSIIDGDRKMRVIDRVYTETNNLCSAIFEIYDNIRYNQIISRENTVRHLKQSSKGQSFSSSDEEKIILV